MAEKWKIDVTSQIKGHVEDGNIILTFNGKPIKRVPLEQHISEIMDGYHIENGRILKETRFNELDVNEEYAQDCDMGWC
jgi:hypothetical protein